MRRAVKKRSRKVMRKWIVRKLMTTSGILVWQHQLSEGAGGHDLTARKAL